MYVGGGGGVGDVRWQQPESNQPSNLNVTGTGLTKPSGLRTMTREKAKREKNSPGPAFQSAAHRPQTAFRADAQLGQKVARALQVDLADVGETTQHAVHVGVDALPVGTAIFGVDLGVGRRCGGGGCC